MPGSGHIKRVIYSLPSKNHHAISPRQKHNKEPQRVQVLQPDRSRRCRTGRSKDGRRRRRVQAEGMLTAPESCSGTTQRKPEHVHPDQVLRVPGHVPERPTQPENEEHEQKQQREPVTQRTEEPNKHFFPFHQNTLPLPAVGAYVEDVQEEHRSGALCQRGAGAHHLSVCRSHKEGVRQARPRAAPARTARGWAVGAQHRLRQQLWSPLPRSRKQARLPTPSRLAQCGHDCSLRTLLSCVEGAG